jgi:hypothetical protein
MGIPGVRPTIYRLAQIAFRAITQLGLSLNRRTTAFRGCPPSWPPAPLYCLSPVCLRSSCTLCERLHISARIRSPAKQKGNGVFHYSAKVTLYVNRQFLMGACSHLQVAVRWR